MIKEKQIFYRALSAEDSWYPALALVDDVTPLHKMLHQMMDSGQVPDNWCPEDWVFRKVVGRRSKKKPDISNDFRFHGLMFSAKAAAVLYPNGPMPEIHFLPITVENELWYYVVCTAVVDAVDKPTSSCFFSHAPDAVKRRNEAWSAGDAAFRIYLDSSEIYENLINVTDPSVADLDMFHILHPYSAERFVCPGYYVTEKFKSRYEASGLQGLQFHQEGYIVDGPANAVMPKKLEPPRQELPRWTQAREADPEPLQKLKQAGQHWYAQQGFGAETDGLVIVRAIEAVVQHHGENRHKLKKAAWAQLELELQGAWGLLLERDLGWQWLEVAVGMRTYALAVQTPNGSHALCLPNALRRQFRNAPETTLELTYNMLKAGNLPPGEAGQRVSLN